MKILITAGGTQEQIDNVRSIANTSTGRLGSLIADAFASRGDVEKIYYVCSRKAARPETGKVEIVYVDDVASLENAVKNILGQTEIDIIVHSMAVSDYRVKSVTSAAHIADLIASGQGSLKDINSGNAEAAVAEWIREAKSVIGDSGKISSNVDDMILLMERTPKIISLFQTLSPKSVLVGFKLLDHVTHEALMDAAFHIMSENKCSFVLANDLADISGDRHVGYLADENKNYKKYTTKKEIADAIVTASISRRNISK